MLEHLRARYRRAKTLTLIVDNYIIHKSRETQRWLEENPKFRVIYQSVEKFGYHMQAAFYEFVVGKVFGLDVDFAFCAVGKRPDCGRYPVLLSMLDEEDGYTGAAT